MWDLCLCWDAPGVTEEMIKRQLKHKKERSDACPGQCTIKHHVKPFQVALGTDCLIFLPW